MATQSEPDIAQRKADHLAIAASGEADFRRNPTLLDAVHLLHHALPELAVPSVNLNVTLAGQVLAAPLMVTGMTGGTQQAAAVNRDLAIAAEKCGVALGLGSQRAMAEHPELIATYAVRQHAPNVVLFGNIGGVQAKNLGVAKVRELGKQVEANAMCVHLNPGQELIQTNGDRDFTGVRDVIAALVDHLDMPVIVKETGCGLAPRVAADLRRLGVAAVDVAGAGGTSWIAVEAKRAAPGTSAQSLGEEFSDWGLPTAVSTAVCAAAGLTVIASGGIRGGLDIARAVALGATVGGMAAPILRAQMAAGAAGVIAAMEQAIAGIRTACVLTGSPSVAALQRAPRHLAPALTSYLTSVGL